MRKLNFVLGLIVLAVFFSCETPIGQWSDNIKLSTRSATFSANGDSIIIKTKGSWWWINDITINEKAAWYSMPQFADSTQYTIGLDSILVQRRDKNTLSIKASKNNNKTQRIIDINLEAGDYFDSVDIIQKGQ
jgi:hypothetical protein